MPYGNFLSCIQDKLLCRILAATRNEVKDARGHRSLLSSALVLQITRIKSEE